MRSVHGTKEQARPADDFDRWITKQRRNDFPNLPLNEIHRMLAGENIPKHVLNAVQKLMSQDLALNGWSNDRDALKAVVSPQQPTAAARSGSRNPATGSYNVGPTHLLVTRIANAIHKIAPVDRSSMDTGVDIRHSLKARRGGFVDERLSHLRIDLATLQRRRRVEDAQSMNRAATDGHCASYQWNAARDIENRVECRSRVMTLLDIGPSRPRAGSKAKGFGGHRSYHRRRVPEDAAGDTL